MDLSMKWSSPVRLSLFAMTVGAVLLSFVVVNTASAQFGIPHFGKKKPPAQEGSAPSTMPTMPVPNSSRQPATPQVNPPGVPMAPDSPVYTSYKLLQARGSYKMIIAMQAAGPQVAQAAATGFGIRGIETDVKGDVHKSVMHYTMPASDSRGHFMPGVIDDWEASGVIQNGMSARKFYSPTATPRILAMDEAQAAQEMAMIDRMMGSAILREASQGPIGAATAAYDVGMTAVAHMEVAATLKKARDYFTWQCEPRAQSTARQTVPELTDLAVVGDDSINGVAVSKYDFYVLENGKFNGPIRLSVAKNSGMPVRLEMTDPGGMGSMTMDYDTTTPVDFEIPPCMAGSR